MIKYSQLKFHRLSSAFSGITNIELSRGNPIAAGTQKL